MVNVEALPVGRAFYLVISLMEGEAMEMTYTELSFHMTIAFAFAIIAAMIVDAVIRRGGRQ